VIDLGGELAVLLLGHPEVRIGDRPVTLPTRKALLLLAILVVEGGQTRERLTALLWPEADEERGRTNLRRTLAYLRDGIGREREPVLASREGLAPGKGLRSDLDRVRAAAAGKPDLDRLAAAAAAWRGDFLAGLQPEGEELDAWVSRQREAWHQRLALISERLAELQSDAGEAPAGLETVERWLARDPLSETAHRLRVRLHLERGDRTAALEAYAACERVLAEELGIQPAAATRTLAERARQDEPRSAASTPATFPELPMVGRAAEHRALVAAWRRAEARRPQLVVVAGEPGIGKSRLMAEFADWATAAGADVLRGRAYPSSRKLTYQALGEALGRRLAAAPAQLPDEPWRSELARILPQVGRPRPHRAGGDLLLFDAAARLLRSLSTEATLLLAIDDLQWLDADSLALLSYVAGVLDSERWLLLLTVREDELDSSSTLRDWMAAVTRELPLTDVRLRPLEPSDSERLLQLWPEPLSARPGRLVEEAAGRPLLMLESLRYLSAGGDPAGLPPAARGWMQARLRTLSDSATLLAEAAAVLERAVTSETMARVAGLEAVAVEGAFEELLRRRILSEGEGWSFSHEMLRRAAYESLTGARRRRLHARAAAELDVPANAAEVARHAELAGNVDMAWEKWLQAGHAAMGLPAHRVAAEHFAAAIALRPRPSPAWLDLGRAYELGGRADAAAATYRALLDRARRAGESALEAAALVRLGEFEGRAFSEGHTDELLEEAGEVAAGAGDQAMELEAVLAAAQVAAYRMELVRAELEGKVALRRARRLHRPDLVARSLNLLGFVYQGQGRWKLTLQVARRAAAAYAALGEDLMRIDSEGYVVAGLVFGGDWKEGARLGRRLLGEARRLQNPWAVAHMCLVLGWALYDGGRLDQARRLADDGQQAAGEAGFLPLQVLNAALGGRCRRDLEQLEAALEVHRQAWQWSQHLNALALQAIAEEICADHAAAGRWDEAASWAEESRRHWGGTKMFVHLGAWTVAEALLRKGAAYSPPELPEGDRYRLVGLRVAEVVGRLAGRRETAESALRDARDLALGLNLPLQVAELEAAVTASPEPG
jgi:DNA-binding SARP family transcriptional activator